MGLLNFVAVLSLLYVTVPQCTGTYYFYVEVQSFSNPGNQDSNENCCDIGCGNCDNYFIFCLRAYGYDGDICPYGSFSTSSNVQGGSSLTFSTGSSALANNVPNPLQYAGTTWPGGFELKVRALDEDLDAADLIETWFIAESTFLPTNEWTEFTTYIGTTDNEARITLRFKLRCRGDWHGYQCNIRCEDVNTDIAHLECALDGSYVCMEGWQDLSTDCTVSVCQEGCHLTGGMCTVPGECNCVEGWSGELCDQCDVLSGCQHGYCTHPNDCTCEQDYEGTLCNIDLDPCGHQTPCANGECNNDGPNLCTCDAGYTGTNCDVDIDECFLNPCQNEGSCENLVNGFTCSCAVGWTGDTCGDNIDECVEVAPCQNSSTCHDCTPTTYFDDVDDTVVMECTLGYTCECPPGYFGDDCSLLIDHCDPDPCVNVVVCHDLLLGYFCECLPGYTGADCDTEFDYCEEMQPCNNGATCQNLYNGEMYSCSCAPGFTGRDCGTNIDDCPGNSCTAATTASCVDDVEGYTCQCLPGYSGTFCEEEIDECEEYGCLNGGTCEDLVGDFSCVCPDLFTGNACEEPIDGDQCLPMPCVNGGTCVDEIRGFKCLCPANFKGTACEEKSSPGDPSDPCGDITCKSGEACVVLEADEQKCELCDNNGLAGCDESAAISNNEEDNSNVAIVVGPIVGGLLLLLLLVALIIFCCCCWRFVVVIFPCCERDKVEEQEAETGRGTLSGPYSSVTNNAMFIPADMLASQSVDTLTRSAALQNPMYGASGGMKSNSLSTNGGVPNPTNSKTPEKIRRSSAQTSPYHRLPTEEPEKMELEDLEVDEDHPYEELEPLQAKMGTSLPTSVGEYQKLSESTEGKPGTNGPYASLSPPPVAQLQQQPSQQYMHLMSHTRQENPYIMAPNDPLAASPSHPVPLSVASPEKTDAVKEKEDLVVKDVEPAYDKLT